MPRQKQAAAVAVQPLATADFELFCGTKDEADAVHRPHTSLPAAHARALEARLRGEGVLVLVLFLKNLQVHCKRSYPYLFHYPRT